MWNVARCAAAEGPAPQAIGERAQAHGNSDRRGSSIDERLRDEQIRTRHAAAQTPVDNAPIDPETWLLSRFRSLAVGGDRVDDPLSVNLFEAGWLDSIGLIDLVAHLEETFRIRFDEHHLRDDRFTSIAGIATIVRAAMKDSGSLAKSD